MQRTHVVWQAAGIVAVGLVLAAGCASQKKNTKAQCNQNAAPNCPQHIVVFSPPVTDEMMQTASTNYIDERSVQESIRQRDWPTSTTYYAPQVVKHGPLYFEDPFETVEHSVNNCPEGWTWVDYFDIAYSDARWLLNTFALPVSMVVNPPWQAMCSDGIPSRRLIDGKVDASPCTQPVAEPYDLKCQEQRVAAMAAVGGEEPLVVEPNPAHTTTPATQPGQ